MADVITAMAAIMRGRTIPAGVITGVAAIAAAVTEAVEGGGGGSN